MDVKSKAGIEVRDRDVCVGNDRSGCIPDIAGNCPLIRLAKNLFRQQQLNHQGKAEYKQRRPLRLPPISVEHFDLFPWVVPHWILLLCASVIASVA